MSGSEQSLRAYRRAKRFAMLLSALCAALALLSAFGIFGQRDGVLILGIIAAGAAFVVVFAMAVGRWLNVR